MEKYEILFILLLIIISLYPIYLPFFIDIFQNKDELIEIGKLEFVNELNKERIKYGLLPLEISNESIAQKKAELLSKYNVNAHILPSFIENYSYPIPPQLFYTYFGGKHYFEENIFIGFGIVLNEKDLKNKVKVAVKEFIYNDEDSNFGHRDSLLNPCHNKIDVGIYFDSLNENITLLQMF